MARNKRIGERHLTKPGTIRQKRRETEREQEKREGDKPLSATVGLLALEENALFCVPCDSTNSQGCPYA